MSVRNFFAPVPSRPGLDESNDPQPLGRFADVRHGENLKSHVTDCRAARAVLYAGCGLALVVLVGSVVLFAETQSFGIETEVIE